MLQLDDDPKVKKLLNEAANDLDEAEYCECCLSVILSECIPPRAGSVWLALRELRRIGGEVKLREKAVELLRLNQMSLDCLRSLLFAYYYDKSNDRGALDFMGVVYSLCRSVPERLAVMVALSSWQWTTNDSLAEQELRRISRDLGSEDLTPEQREMFDRSNRRYPS